MEAMRDIWTLIMVMTAFLKALPLPARAGGDFCIFCCLLLTFLVMAVVLLFIR